MMLRMVLGLCDINLRPAANHHYALHPPYWALEENNVEAAKILLSEQLPRGVIDNCATAALNRWHHDMLAQFLQYDPNLSYAILGDKMLISLSATPKPEDEVEIITCVDMALNYFSNKIAALSVLFVSNANSFCSVTLAKYLLRQGVNIDTQLHSAGDTALCRAAYLRSRAAAEFMKFLLESGADPKLKLPGKQKDITDFRRSKNVSKWLGVSWEELVSQSQGVYAATQQKAQ